MYKQVIIIRKDLKLGKGKIAAQVAHASLEAYKKTDPKIREKWEAEGTKKVVLKVDNLSQLRNQYAAALKAGLPCSIIKDAGRTEIKRGTITAVGIGPALEKNIDKITKHLKLL